MIFQKLAKYSLRAFVILVLTSLASLVAIYFFLQRSPEELANKYLVEAAKKAGLDLSFKSIHVTLLPLPAIGIGDLNIKGKDCELNIAWLSLRPNLGALLRGALAPGNIILLRPKLYIESETLFRDPRAFLSEVKGLFKGSGEGKASGAPEMPSDCALQIVQGYSIASGGGGKAVLSNLNARLELDRNGDLSGKADFAYLRASEDGKASFSLDAVKAEGECSLYNFDETESRISVSGRSSVGRFLQEADFTANLTFSDFDWALNVEAAALINMDGVLLPASYNGRIFSLSDSMEIISRKSDFSMDADSGNLEFRFRLPTSRHAWSLEGKLAMRRLSLTQWLGFARGLPAGLQMALDNITGAKMDFFLDAKTFKASDIIASSTGATFTGEGGVPDLARPVVELDLKSNQANLGLVIPESLVKSPLNVYFPYEPLTPRSGIPLKEGEAGVGYDIRLAAKKLIYGPVIINNAKLRIHPGKMDVMRLEDVLLDASGDFYGGAIKANCILGADPSMPVYIGASAKNVDAAGLAKAMPVLPFTKGTLDGESKVFSRGKTLNEFMRNLDGPISVSGSKVVMGAAVKEPISRLLLKSKLKGGQILKNSVNFDGAWSLEASLAKLSAALTADGSLTFSEKGLSVKSLPGVLKLNFPEKLGFLPPKSAFVLRGQLSGQSGADKFSLDKLSLELPGARITGNIAMNAKTINASGELSANINDSGKLLNFFAVQGASVPAGLAKMLIDASYTASEKGIAFPKLKLRAGELHADGNLNFLFQGEPTLEFDLNINEIDWDRQFAGGQSAKKGNWDFSSLKDFNCKGRLKANAFSGWGARLTKIALPITMQKGKLSVQELTANFYGALLKVQAEAVFDKNINFKTIISVNEFKLEEAVKDQKIESVLAGKASVGATLTSNLTGPGQIPAKLDGIWNFKIISGYWQGKEKNGKLKGSPTRLDLVRASGKMRDGRMESSDILIKNSEMQVSGEGWLNLTSRKIDCKLNVNMNNLPDFPLYVYGPIDKPSTAIGAGKMVLNALGGLTSGIGNMFGNLVKGLVNIF